MEFSSSSCSLQSSADLLPETHHPLPQLGQVHDQVKVVDVQSSSLHAPPRVA